MPTLQINCFLYFVCSCPTSLKPLWSLPKYSYATGTVLVTQLLKESRQQIYRLKLNNNQETPWQPHRAVTWCARAQGEERLKSCGEACGSSWPPQEPAATTLKGSSGCYGEGDTEIHPPRLRRGEGKVALGSDHKIQGEEPLAKESWDRSGGAEEPMHGLLGHWSHFVQFTLMNLSIPQAGASSSPGAPLLLFLPSSGLLQALVSSVAVLVSMEIKTREAGFHQNHIKTQFCLKWIILLYFLSFFFFCTMLYRWSWIYFNDSDL